jgi:hypothetical protein
MRAQPVIAVRDVEASSRWYQQLLTATARTEVPSTKGLDGDNSLAPRNPFIFLKHFPAALRLSKMWGS